MTSKTEIPFILVDGSSYLHRAYHALPPLTTEDGQPTGAIFGVMNMIRRLINDYHPKYMAVVFDAKGKNFRHKIYPEYKANRPPMPDDLKVQLEPLYKIIRAMRIPLLVIEGVEADDVIGTLAHQVTKSGKKVLISTSDKDFAQLVNDDVTLINTMSDTLLDPKGVEKKFGIKPEQMIDYLTLVGDTSDNIPGVPKVGPKTAVKWLEEYGSLDEIIKHADEIKGKVGENLRASLEQLPISKQLATIKCDVELDFKPDDLVDEEDDKEALKQIFNKLEFRTWLKDLGNGNGHFNIAGEVNYETILEEKKLEEWIEKLSDAKLIAVDTETTSLDYMNAEIVGISFAIEPFHAIYIPLAHHYEEVPQQLNLDETLIKLQLLLENPEIKKVGQHIKYDIEVFANYNIHLQGVAFDTMLESYILDSTLSQHSLDFLSQRFLGHKTISYEDVAGKGAKSIPFSEVKIAEATQYAAEDADITLRLHQYFWPKLVKEDKLKSVLLTIEMPLVNVLVDMERHGVLIDAEFLYDQSKKLAKQLKETEEEIYKISDSVFNIESPKQLQEILYDKLKLPILKKTPLGQPSTAEPVLQELALIYPLPKLILEYRSLSKLKSTYTDKLPEQINKKTGRVHTSYHQAVTTTGRLSSTDPNLQNIPIRTKEGRKIRQAFIAPKGYKILAADYSQIELRIMAHLSQDTGLLKAFANNHDIHSATAAEIFNVDLDKVTNTQRRKAKAINFGLIYGMSAFGLAKQIGVDRHVAQEYIDSYFTKYPKVEAYMENMRELAHKQGYVETLYGRRLYTPEINSSNQHRQNAAERAAINAPMQGTAADIIKIAMLHVQDWLNSTSIDACMIMQVHDELVFEVAEKDVEKAEEKVNELMTHAVQLSVPIVVEIGVGDNWDEAH